MLFLLVYLIFLTAVLDIVVFWLLQRDSAANYSIFEIIQSVTLNESVASQVTYAFVCMYIKYIKYAEKPHLRSICQTVRSRQLGQLRKAPVVDAEVQVLVQDTEILIAAFHNPAPALRDKRGQNMSAAHSETMTVKWYIQCEVNESEFFDKWETREP